MAPHITSSNLSWNWDEFFSRHTWRPRMLIIDDNPSIHEDVKKVLSVQTTSHNHIEQLENELFGSSESFESSENAWIQNLRIDSAWQGEQAVEMMRQSEEEGQPYFLAFVDVRMPPGINGIETIKRLWNIHPNLYTVICSAYSDFSWSDVVSYLGPSPHLLILQKPFDTSELLQIVLASMQKYVWAQMIQETQQKMEHTLRERTLALQDSDQKAKIILASIFDGILLLSDDGTIDMINPSVSRIFGYQAEELLGYSITQIIPEFPMKDTSQFASHPASNRPVLVWEQEGCHKNASKLILDLGLTTIHFHHPPERKWLCVCRDITEKKNTEQQLEHAAYHDQLTGLPNRELFYRHIHTILLDSSAIRSSAVFFLDLDQFKGVNDTLGHQAGDTLLQEISARLLQSVRKTDLVARFGGDEFAILLTDLKRPEDSLDVAFRIQEQCRLPVQIQDKKVFVSSSIGVVQDISRYESVEDILRDADIALYQAKAKGRDCYQVFTSQMYTAVARSFQMEMELRQAIEQQQFENEYQPIVDIQTGCICGLEALVRWNHPEQGRMNPGEFIPLAEEKQLIAPIGRQVLQMACQQLQQWKTQLADQPTLRHLSVNVNFSAVQLAHSSAVQHIEHFLSEYHLPPSSLKIEITESVLIKHTQTTLHTLGALKEMGISIVLDDFGTGYSSLSYLHTFPIDQIKLDRTFIRKINEDHRALKFLEAILKMAETLDLSVVAEGIETREQLQHLQRLQCRFGQGYLFSRPLPARQIQFVCHTC